MTDAPAEIEGLTSKAAWWAGARAGLGLPPDTPREVVAQRLAATRAALSEQPAPKTACKGIPRVGCNYLAECDSVCNKCGKVHAVHLIPGVGSTAPVERVALSVTDDMVSRFLSWPLPRDFYPDCGISFDGRRDDEWNKNKTWPIGTNLLTAIQARQMLEHVLGVAHGDME